MTTPSQSPGEGDAGHKQQEDQTPVSEAESQENSEQAQESSQQSQDGSEQSEEDAERPAADVEQPQDASEQPQEDAEQPQQSSEQSEEDSEQSQDGSDQAEEDAEQLGVEQLADAEANAKPKKRKAGLIIGIAAAVVVLLGVGTGLYLLLAGDSAQSVAEDYVALSTKETQDPSSVGVEDYRRLVCNKAMPQIEQMQQQKQEFLKMAKPADFDRLKQIKTTLKNVNANDDSGQVTVESTVPGQQPESATLSLIKEDGGWKLCG